MTHWINDPAYPLENRLRASLSLLAERLLTPASTTTTTTPARSRRASTRVAAIRPQPKRTKS
jgi:hypothetical protein